LPYVRSTLRPVSRFQVNAEARQDSLEHAYAALLEVVQNSPGEWAGWKLGGSNYATCAAFGVNQPYFGPLHHTEILHQPAMAPDFAICELKGEVEIALRIDSACSGYDAWAVCLEMPASAVENLPEAGVETLVADRCGAGALVLGPVIQGPLPNLSTTRFGLHANRRCLSEAGLDSLTAHPAILCDTFLKLSKGLGFTPGPGDWVATGGITGCCALEEGTRAAVFLDDRAFLEFTVSIGSP